MLVIIPQHFEDDFTKRKPILIGFKSSLLGGIPDTYDVCIDRPDDVVEEITKKGHEMFNYIDHFEVEGFVRLDIFNNRGYLINPF